MTDRNHQDDSTVNIIASGKILGGLSEAQVIKKLRQRFNVSEEQALSMLKKGKVLKRDLPQGSANKAVRLFASLGLDVTVVSQSPESHNHATETPNEDVTEQVEVVDISDSRPVKHKAFLSFIAPILVITTPLLILIGILIWVGLIIVNTFIISTLVQVGGIAVVAAVIFILILLAQLFFSIKSAYLILASYPDRQGFIVQKDEAPLLFELVEKLCDRINVSYPNHILLNNDIEIGLSSAGSVFEELKGRFALSIGIPVVACSNLKEVTGLLTYAISLVSQKKIMRLHVLLSAFEDMLETRIYQKNAWDKKLEALYSSEKSWWKSIAIKKLQQASVAIRIFLGWILTFSRRLTAPVKQVIRYHASLYEATFVGQETFFENMLNINKMNDARKVVELLNEYAWRHKKLFRSKANAVAMVVNSKTNIVLAENIENSASELDYNSTFHMLDDQYLKDNHFEQTQTVSIFDEVSAKKDAEVLFEDFYEISEQVTFDNYLDSHIEGKNNVARAAEAYGENPDRWAVDEDEIFQINKMLLSAENAFSDYMGTDFSTRLMELDEPMNPDLLKLDLQEIIDWIRERLIHYREDQKSLKLVQHDLTRKELTHLYSHAGLPIKAINVGNASGYQYTQAGNNNHVGNEINNNAEMMRTRIFEEGVEALTARLHIVDRMYYQRMVLTIQLMDYDEKPFAQHLLTAIQELIELRPLVNRLTLISHLINKVNESRPWYYLPKLKKALLEQAQEGKDALDKIIKRSSHITVYEGENVEHTLSDLLASVMGDDALDMDSLSPRQVSDMCEQVVKTVEYHYIFSFGQLAVLCGKTEIREGVRPLKVVARKSD